MAQLTEYDPKTLKRVVNHDAQRRQRELDEALARINAQNQQTGQPTSAAPAPASVESSGQADPATALTQTIIDIPEPVTPAPVAARPAVQATPAPAIPSPEEYTKLEDRYKKAQAALTPFMQRSARLDTELREERETTKARLDSLEKSITTLVQTLQAQNAPRVPDYDPSLDPELETLDPAISERLRKMHSSLRHEMTAAEKRHQTELQAIKDEETKRQQELAASQAASFQQTWDEIFTKLVPDYMRFMGDNSEAHGLTEWTRRMPTEYGRGIAFPRQHSPHFIAKIIDEYKATLLPAPARQPSLGDLANTALAGSAPTRVVAPEPVRPLSEYELRNAQTILDKLYREATDIKNKTLREAKMAEAEDFLDRYKRHLSNQK